MYHVVMTHYARTAYVSFSYTLDRRRYDSEEGEKIMPFSLSGYYSFSRKHVQTIWRRYLALFAYSWLIPGFLYMFFHYLVTDGGVMGRDGQIFDASSYGLYMIVCCVLIHHV